MIKINNIKCKGKGIISGYNIFFKQWINELKKKKESLSFKIISPKIANEWKNINKNKTTTKK